MSLCVVSDGGDGVIIGRGVGELLKVIISQRNFLHQYLLQLLANSLPTSIKFHIEILKIQIFLNPILYESNSSQSLTKIILISNISKGS